MAAMTAKPTPDIEIIPRVVIGSEDLTVGDWLRRSGSGSPTTHSFSREGLRGHELQTRGLEVPDATAMTLLQGFGPLQERSASGLRGLLVGQLSLVIRPPFILSRHRSPPALES